MPILQPHFTVTILPHVYVEGDDIHRDACKECNYPEDMPFHPKCICAKHPMKELGAHYTNCPHFSIRIENV